MAYIYSHLMNVVDQSHTLSSFIMVQFYQIVTKIAKNNWTPKHG